MAILAAPGIDLDDVKPVIPSSVFMAGSHAAKHLNFVALLQQADQIGKIHMSATGGVQGWKDVAEYILYGASSVQIQTLFMVQGFGIIERMKSDLSDWMEAKGFASVQEMRGAILPKLVTFDDSLAVLWLQQKAYGAGCCRWRGLYRLWPVSGYVHF